MPRVVLDSDDEASDTVEVHLASVDGDDSTNLVEEQIPTSSGNHTKLLEMNQDDAQSTNSAGTLDSRHYKATYLLTIECAPIRAPSLRRRGCPFSHDQYPDPASR